MFQTNPCFQSILYFKYLDNLKDEIKYIDDKFKPLFDDFIETIKDTCFKYCIYNDYKNEEYIGNFISDGYSHEEIEESILNRKLALKFMSEIYDQPMGGWYGWYNIFAVNDYNLYFK